MTTQERFLHYITYDTQSDEDSALTPSTPKQKRLGARLAQELQEMGLEHAHLAENGAVYSWLPATAGKEDLPVLALIAHMDTAPRVPGENVKANLVRYEGGDLVLNAERGIVMTPANFPDLNDQVGKELIVTDGTTLLGADDKAGVAEIFSAVAYLAEHPELSHGRVAVCITPDEEVGRGADYIDLDLLGADFAYTVDGGPLGTLEYENFNAASAEVVIHGVNIHPGDAKNKMKNACLDGGGVDRHGPCRRKAPPTPRATRASTTSAAWRGTRARPSSAGSSGTTTGTASRPASRRCSASGIT